MGFTEGQARAALKACGGSDVSCLDDLVAWIFEHAAASSEPAAAAIEAKPGSGKTIDLSTADKAVAAELEKEKLRVAAKKEEQRRINRNWNSQQSVRQREDVSERSERVTKECAATNTLRS